MSRKRPSSPSTIGEALSAESVQVFRSASIEDRSSTFIAAFSPTLSAKQLQALPEFKSAMHRMAGWRKPSNQQTLVGTTIPVSSNTATTGLSSNVKTTFISGSDDDGEKYGGRRIEKVLNELEIHQGSLVVARWFGGIMLGPVRFTHIENVAKEAISKWRESLGSEESSGMKRQKLQQGQDNDNDPAVKARLTKQLESRDQSIVVLRQLLAEKNASQTIRGSESRTRSDGQSSVTSPAKPFEYSTMTLQRLKQLDKARDATIAWLLKQIDAAEASTSNIP